jgi:uncharacterized membrane protein (UPF0182 family)
LKRVIVSNGERIAMEETLDRALAAIFGEVAVAAPLPAAVQSAGAARPAGDETLAGLAAGAVDRYRAAQERLKAGDFAGYGQELKELERTLERLRERTGARPSPPSARPGSGGTP